MRKQTLVAAVLAAMVAVFCLAACTGTTGDSPQATPDGSANNAGNANNAGDAPIKVVCATFPAYDWVRQVAGDEAGRLEMTYLMSSGVDLHSYEPSVEDVAKISDADLFVYVGGESDGWAQDAVAAANNPNLRTVNMLEAMGGDAVEEETVEGMQADEGEDEDEAEGEGPEYDEHVWLSLRNAQVLVDAIARELGAIDPDHANAYTANAKAYASKLSKLDARYTQAVQDAAHNTVVFADRFPFRYLVDDYDLAYYAAFAGCSAETEASFNTVAFLAQKVDELGLGAVLVIEDSDQHIAKTVVQNTAGKDQRILTMDSLQSVPQSEVDAGKTYLGTMESNLGVLSEALA